MIRWLTQDKTTPQSISDDKNKEVLNQKTWCSNHKSSTYNTTDCYSQKKQ